MPTETTETLRLAMMDTRHYALVQAHRRYNIRVNPNGNHGSQVVMIYQCRFIDCNKCIMLVGRWITREATHLWDDMGIWHMDI